MSNALETMLRESLWARALTREELDRVVRESYERSVPAGGFIARRGEPADHWIGLIDGLMKMSVSLPDGRASTFSGVTAGGWDGEGALLTRSGWRHDRVALRPTRVACMPRHSFERLSSNLEFNRFLLLHLSARLSLFMGLMEFDRLLGPDARVARSLSSLFDPILHPRAPRFVRLSQDEIGLLSAVSRQRANRALHALQREGLLRIEHGGVEVLDLARLRRYPCEADGVLR